FPLARVVARAVAAFDRQLDLFRERILQLAYAGAAMKNAADLVKRAIDARMPAQHATREGLCRARRSKGGCREGGGDENIADDLRWSAQRPRHKRRHRCHQVRARKVLKDYTPPADADWFGQNWLRNWNPGNAPI